MSINFNESSKDKPEVSSSNDLKPGEDIMDKEKRTGERTRFIHKANPLVDRAYQIFEYDVTKSDYDHVGDYILIQKDEPQEVTEKKVINLMTLLNGKDDLIDLSNLTNTRLLYSIVPEAQAGNQTKIVLKDYDGSGVSKENAIFTIRKGVLHDKFKR
ncbi:MAG: hypothetical protein COB14_00155 [Alphaproteobacteria bacterium]|nr:MAG: hypothetical protein COB14_00155 [Alphaproteobacteria bacterium]